MVKKMGMPEILRSLPEIMAPEHAAFVVWDVQNALTERSFNKEEFTGNLKAFLAAARQNDLPIVYTLITPLPRHVESPFRIYMQMRRAGVDDQEKLPQSMEVGSPGVEICSEVRPAEGDIVINKHTADIFVGTHFENMLRNRGVKTILFTGVNTEIGIASSARSAANRGFYTVVVSDCVSSGNRDLHEITLKVLASVCLVVPSREIMATWP